jgi:hypothetical protein
MDEVRPFSIVVILPVSKNLIRLVIDLHFHVVNVKSSSFFS